MSNPAGRLHDAGLQRALLGLMQRMFLALVADMRRLGAHLISASFGSVLICTGKRNMSAAGARAGAESATGAGAKGRRGEAWA